MLMEADSKYPWNLIDSQNKNICFLYEEISNSQLKYDLIKYPKQKNIYTRFIKT